MDAPGLDWDHRERREGIYRIVGGNHKGWSKLVDTENGNYDYLLGIDVRLLLYLKDTLLNARLDRSPSSRSP